MKKTYVILALILIPSFAFAAAGNSATATLNSTMTILTAIGITQQQAMVFPTSVNGLSPSTWDTTMASAVAGGAAGTNGVLRITSAGGTASLTLAATTIGAYPITFAALSTLTNTTSIALTASPLDLTIKGTINAGATPFTAGTFAATTACTISYK
ncbi:MAG: hypothetical protein NTY22_06800 [Proteobacteria bacterium]|nr:hypothetical protein [Pseudomonadota bacterium]